MSVEQPTTCDVVTGNTTSNWIWALPIYMFAYSLLSIWVLFDGWLTGFSSVLSIWDLKQDFTAPPHVSYLLFTMIGALLGSAILGIISFHRYYAIEQTFDTKHMWGFWFSPLLALLVGCLVFAIVQSGLLVLTGDLASSTNPERATLGYLAIGGVAGYNWDVFVKKLESLSSELLNSKKQAE